MKAQRREGDKIIYPSVKLEWSKYICAGCVSRVSLWALSNLNNYWVANIMAPVVHILS